MTAWGDGRGMLREAVAKPRPPKCEVCQRYSVRLCCQCFAPGCDLHSYVCNECRRGPYCGVCANPTEHTCIPPRPPVPQAEDAPRWKYLLRKLDVDGLEYPFWSAAERLLAMPNVDVHAKNMRNKNALDVTPEDQKKAFDPWSCSCSDTVVCCKVRPSCGFEF